jgi:tagatose 1,6-diphosphate aldolase GatY/KbaY
VKAAIACKSPVILQVHPSSLKFGGLPLLEMLASFRDEAKLMSTAIYLQLDHITSEEDIQMICKWGKADAIMIDGSDKAFDENLLWTKAMTEEAHRYGMYVEGELGKIAGKEDGLDVSILEAKMTDPEQARRFVDETKIDSLAVTIGNVHGDYSRPPNLDFDRLVRIRELLGR